MLTGTATFLPFLMGWTLHSTPEEEHGATAVIPEEEQGYSKGWNHPQRKSMELLQGFQRRNRGIPRAGTTP